MQNRAVPLPLHVVFALNHVPMAIFAVGLIAATFALMGRVQVDLAELALRVADDIGERAEMDAFARRVTDTSLVALGAFLASGSLTAATLAWGYRKVSGRVAMLTALAERIAAGEAVALASTFTRDPLGRLERTLGDLARQIRERQAALQMEMARQQQEVQIQRAFSMAESEPEAMAVARRILDALEVSGRASLMLADSSMAHMTRVLAPADEETEPVCPVESPHQCVAVRQGHTAVFDTSRALDACPKLTEHPSRGCSAVCLPVTVMGRAVGALRVTGPEHEPPSRQTLLGVDALTRHLGVRVGMIRAFETSQIQAQTDPLTGLLNRRTLEAKVAALLRGSAIFAVAVCDLDHFKQLNDTRGHEEGDRALRRFAAVLRRALRPADILARYGGEEFVVVLPGCSVEDAASVMNRAREALARSAEHGEGPAFTVSVGIAQPKHGASFEDVFRIADRAMYAAKAAGRNRVVVAGGNEET